MYNLLRQTGKDPKPEEAADRNGMQNEDKQYNS